MVSATRSAASERTSGWPAAWAVAHPSRRSRRWREQLKQRVREKEGPAVAVTMEERTVPEGPAGWEQMWQVGMGGWLLGGV